ncbi:transposase [Aliiglaciecola lipolytica]|uniref:Transposase IS200-like domain-containing protein n=1 Tax=Aliiglaciecola lipolytica E3 TaxID=1127673 RepID=K6X4F8_9ALTE|nr:transposase [Aliiglaciecola lipolytica]GAC15509.1 hypothetical protein GLIP_2888 [Aliiglaciecola lipolytica E3]
MPLPRKSQISLVDTPYYHCVSRCVRRAYLCGKDKHTGQNYEHRRQWVEDRLILLASVFCIDVCAYAVMSNHVHVVLHVNKAKALSLSDKEVIKRWQIIHRPSSLAQQYIQNSSVNFSKAHRLTLSSTVSIYRQRLYDISWFMRELNEPIARQANKEDDCTGHFWEGRFKSQALLDEKALLACMVYVDLNPVRANIADTPDKSKHTSIKRRIDALNQRGQPTALMPFQKDISDPQTNRLPFKLNDYLELIYFSYQKTLTKMQSKRPSPRLLQTHTIPYLFWEKISQHFEANFGIAAGEKGSIKRFKLKSRKRLIGISA